MTNNFKVAHLLLLLASICLTAVVVKSAIYTGSNGKTVISLNLERETTDTSKARQSIRSMKANIQNAPIYDYKNVFYYVPMHFGSDTKNTYKMYLDSDVGLVYVTSSKCSQCWLHPRYDHSKSSTYKADGRNVQWSLYFTYYGVLSNDQVAFVGENGQSEMIIKNVTFAELIKTDDAWVETANSFDGIIGFSRVPEKDMTGTYDFPGFMSIVKKSYPNIDNIFSIYLSELFNPNEQQQNGKGQLILGGYDNKYFSGQMNWFPLLNNTPHWMIEFDGVKVNGEWFKYVDCKSGAGGKCKAILDTGIGNIVMNTHYFQFFQLYAHASIPANCGDVDYSKIPTFAIVINGIDFVISPKDYVITQQTPLFGQKICSGAFAGAGNEVVGPNTFILGQVWHALFYNVYDAQNGRIGIAKANHQ
ncbi:hypothetical protein ABK040_003125 [Willaertia magna]